KSGMQAGMTSPARPWYALGTFDPDLREFKPVKEWLEAVERVQRDTFQGSNIYNMLHSLYGDIGLFGTSGNMLVADEETELRGMGFLMGEYYLATDHRGIVNTLYRRADMTVEQMISRFGLGKVSQSVKNLWDCGDKLVERPIWHAVQPRIKAERDESDRVRSMPWKSVYWEEGAKDVDILSMAGFQESPLLCPRWDTMGNDVYGVSPGMDVLPDLKELQTQRRAYGQAVDQGVKPAMIAPTSMRNEPKSHLPGSVTYLDDPTGRGYRRAVEIDLDAAILRDDMNTTRQHIREGFYADLWAQFLNDNRVQPRTATEIAERKEEKLIELGPVVERLQTELLKPIIDRSFLILERAGLLPPPPPELQGKELKVEYISMLAQAQKAVGTGSIERLIGFGLGIAQAKPDVLDKINTDQAIDEMADLLGTPPSIIVADTDVEKTREARAQAQQQAAQMEMAGQAAAAAKDGGAAASDLVSATQGGGASDLLDRLGLGG
ncbi:MAG: portal protein, partial [Gammaproteobacteria bacterium]|nr:portal protein [Gammaproteobacteria bacterium]